MKRVYKITNMTLYYVACFTGNMRFHLSSSRWRKEQRLYGFLLFVASTNRDFTFLLRMEDFFALSKEDAPDNIPMMFITIPSSKDTEAKVRHPGTNTVPPEL